MLPAEKIIGTDFFLMITNHRSDVLDDRPVDLACGHKALTKNKKSVRCPRCAEMLRRSLADGSEDWDAFRHHGKADTMIWLDDPMRQFNERVE